MFSRLCFQVHCDKMVEMRGGSGRQGIPTLSPVYGVWIILRGVREHLILRLGNCVDIRVL